jgi:mono/diheme cytochrome c family protein
MSAMALTVVVMAYLTYAGANAGPPSEIDLAVPRQYEPGKEVVAQSGCLACHKIGENGNGALGPDLTEVGARIPRNAILRSLVAGPGIMPSFENLGQKKLNEVADFLSYLK